MVKRRGPPGQGWHNFLQNHTPDLAAMDLFMVSTVNFSFKDRILEIQKGLGRRSRNSRHAAVCKLQREAVLRPANKKATVNTDPELILKLTINGEKQEEKEEKKAGYHLSERRFGSFERSFALPEGVDADKIEASVTKAF